MTAAPAESSGVEVCGRCRQVRPRRALTRVPAAGEPAEWRCTAPCSPPGGRPPVGPPVLVRMPPQLRADIEALSLPGETLAATVRRLLSAAVADAQADREPVACPGCGRWHSGWIPPGCPLSAASSPVELG